MSYLHKGDKLRSTVTGKEYPLPPRGTDRDGSQTRAVTRQLLEDNAAVTRAAVQRNGRELAPREAITGRVIVPVAKPVRTTGQPGAPDPDANPWASTLATAQADAKKALLPADKASAMRRVDVYRAKYDAWQGNRDAEKAAEQVAADPARETALIHANAEFDLLRLRGDVSESHIQSALARLDSLTAGTIDAPTYFAQADEAQAALASERKAAADALDAQARELRAQAKAVRRNEPSARAPEPESPAAEGDD